MPATLPDPLPAPLPDDLRLLLHAALPADAPTPAADARLKQRLLRAMAVEATPRHLTVAADAALWQGFGPGLQIKVLHQDGDTMSYLLRLAPGAGLPPHRHPVDEECVVLEGEVQIGTLRLAAGGFHLGRRDLPHDRLQSEHGALIYLRGAVPELSLVL